MFYPEMNKRLNRAQELLTQLQFAEAEQLCRSSIKLGRDLVVAKKMLAISLYNRSLVLLGHSDLYAEAESLLREALLHAPDYPDALNNLGALFLKTNRPKAAVPILEHNFRLANDKVRALENLALAQQEAGDLDAASISLQKLAELARKNSALYLIREALLFPAVPESDAEIIAARKALATKLATLLQRNDLYATNPLHFPSTYFPLTYHGLPNAELNRMIAQLYARACPSLSFSASHVSAWQGPRQRIRIGIISAFLQEHSVGKICAGFFVHADRSRFELIAFRLHASTNDPIAQSIDQSAASVIDLSGQSLKRARQTIADLELDVLFFQDIGMEPMSYFLALARLAPVQLTWFGHPDTTGILNIDYFLSWGKFEEADSQAHYTEKLVLLQATGNIAYYRRPTGEDKMITRAQLGFAEGDHLYCCPQQAYKLMPVMDRLFNEIVRCDANARIILFEPVQAYLRQAIEDRLTRHFPSLSSRVRFLPMQEYAAYLRVLQISDVILDSVPFNGYNTTLDAFAMGTPVVTLAGKTMRDRFGLGLYKASGFLDLVAESEAHYVALACRLASDKVFREYCQSRIIAGWSIHFEDISAIQAMEQVMINVLQATPDTRPV
jgi:predicted O-linked N-acetylglucosamine transferase (SPINDLY family)